MKYFFRHSGITSLRAVSRDAAMFVFAPILTLFLLIVLFCLMGHFGKAKQFWIVGSTFVFAECAYFKFFTQRFLSMTS